MFFEIIVAPFLFFIKWIYALAFSLTGSHGLSIILLSFCVSLVLLPIFILIERAKKRNDAIKQRMKPVADEIKRCYKGQERYYYLKTLNKQHGFSPLKALIPVLSLLLQIPFFIAAYQFLKDYEPLAGAQFLFINDLSTPDGLLGSVHLLPILMTLVNVITAYLYTLKGDKSERTQMYVVAGLFLVLLFNLPSGLVLYWTMNNVFSFFRLFITNPEVFRRGDKNQKGFKTIQKKSSSSLLEVYKRKLHEPRTYTLFVIIALLIIASQINWGFQRNFHGFYLRLIASVAMSGVAVAVGVLFSIFTPFFKNLIAKIRVKPIWFYSLLFAGLYFGAAHRFWYGEENQTFAVLSLVFILIIQGISFLYFLQSSRANGRFYSGFVTVMGALLLILQVLHIAAFVSPTPYDATIFGINLLIEGESIGNACWLGVIFTLLFLPFYLKVHALPTQTPNKLHYWAMALAVLFIAANISFWHPLSVFSTFPETFIFSGAKLLASGIKPFMLIAVGLIALYFPLRKDYRWLIPVSLLWVSAIFFIHTYLFPIRVGTLVDDTFTNAQAMRQPQYLYFLEALLGILLFFLLVHVFKNNHVKQVVIALILMNILAAGQSLYKGIRSGSFIQNITAYKASPHRISLSQTQPNILFIIPDMMQGWSLSRMIKENPELMEELEGFVWFPNTLAVSTVTNTSLGPLLGGLDYVPDKLDRDKSRTISEKLGDIKMDVIRQAKEKEMDFTSNRLVYINLPDSCYDNFLPEWHTDWDAYLPKIGIKGTIDKNLDLLKYNALFYNVPLALKPAVYNNGHWLFDNFSKKRDNEAENLKHQFLRLLPYLTNTNEENGSFILYYNFVTHMPWITINDDGTANRDVTPYDNFLWTTQQLVKWFNWMKENGVYDNTRIIIASDHGADWNQYEGDFDIDIPFRNYEGQSVTLKNMFFLNSMLLVKDFNAHGLLTEDWRFMSMADAMGLAFSDTIATALPTDSLRELPAFISWWADGIGQRNSFLLEHKYMVKESIFDGNNWTMVWDKHKGGLIKDN